MSRGKLLLGISAACSAMGAAPSLGQDSGADEIVVTAQKREERLLDVPIAVTSIGGETISRLQLTESLDVARLTPNLNVSAIAGSGTQPNFFLRGVGLNDFSLNNSGPVGVYVDEVYLSSFGAQNFLLYDMDRVEVLRGPQGTLYGRNTTGGAISYFSRRPGDEFDGYLAAEGGEYDSYRVEGAVGGPLGESLRARVAVVRNFSDGFFENLDTGRESNGTDAFGARLMLEADLAPNLTALLRLHGDFNRTPFSQYEHLGLLDPATFAPCSVAAVNANQCVDALGYQDTSGFHQGRFDREGDVDRDAYGASLALNLDLGSTNLVSVTAYQTDEGVLEEESDASPNELLAVTLGNDTWTLSQELRLVGGGDRINWIGGLYYLTEKVKLNNTVDLFRELRPLAEATDPLAFPGGFDPDGLALGAPIFFLRSTGTQKTDTVAAFGQTEIALSDRLTFTGGLRYTWEERSFNPSAILEEPGFSVPLYENLPLSTDASNLSGRVALDFHLTPNALLYASASRGFKSGGFNGSFLFSPAENVPYAPETLNAFEAGYKFAGFGGRVRLNAAAFYYDYSDLQVFTLINSGGLPLSVLTNAADAEIYGAELELGLQPTDAWRVDVALGLLHTELVNFQTFGGQDFSGNELVQSPHVAFSVVTSYDIGLGGVGVLRPQIDLSYKGDHTFSTANDPFSSQGAYWLANLQLTWISRDDMTEIGVFARNIFDEKYFVNRTNLADFGLVQQVTGAPQTFGVRARRRF